MSQLRKGFESAESIRFLEPVRDMETIKKKLWKFGLSIYESEINNNTSVDVITSLKHQANTIFVLNEFENNPLLEHLQGIPGSWVMGPTAVMEIALDPSLEFSMRPTYCKIMSGLVFYVTCPKKMELKKRVVTLIQWMGGMFTKEPTGRTTHMISTSVLVEGYTYCSVFSVPIFTPQWVEACWQNRHTVCFGANQIECIEDFKLKPFSDLKICFKGFSKYWMELAKEYTVKNGGKSVHIYDLECTHVVYSKEFCGTVSTEDIPPHVRFVVKESWFWDSEEKKIKLFEPDYAYTLEEKETSGSIKDNCEVFEALLDKTIDALDEFDDFKENDTEDINKWAITSPLADSESLKDENEDKRSSIILKKDKKRRMVFDEIYQTEKNYIRDIEKLVHLRTISMQPSNSNKAILNSAEAKIIFGNVSNILVIHDTILHKLELTLRNWTNNVITGQIFLDMEKEIKKNYVIYAMNYLKAFKEIKRCESENRGLMQLLNNFFSGQIRNNVDGLLIRPIQRLPSVRLLFIELLKNTREDNPDRAIVVQLINVLEDILNEINVNIDKNEKLEHLFFTHNLIEHCPPVLISSHREFIYKFKVKEMDEKQNLGDPMMFFLFTDILEVTKVRSKAQKQNKNDIFGNQPEKKPFKHIEIISLSSIKRVVEYVDEENYSLNVFALEIKKEKVNHRYSFQYLGEGVFEQDLMKIAEQIAKMVQNPKKKAREFLMKLCFMGKLGVGTVTTEDKTNKPQDSSKWFLSKCNSFKQKLPITPAKDRRRSSSCSELSSLSVAI